MSTGRASRTYLRLSVTAGIVVAVDQVTKEIALRTLADGPLHVIDGVLSLRLVFNPGGAFGILQGVPGFFLVATTAVIIMVLLWARRYGDARWAIPLGLVLGGGIGNLTDRIARDLDGRVVDFIDLHLWPVFNVADASIVAGAGLILLFGATAREEDADGDGDGAGDGDGGRGDGGRGDGENG